MELISLRVPGPYLDMIQEFIKEGYYPNVAEFIRTGIRNQIKQEIFQQKEQDAKQLKVRLGIF